MKSENLSLYIKILEDDLSSKQLIKILKIEKIIDNISFLINNDFSVLNISFDFNHPMDEDDFMCFNYNEPIYECRYKLEDAKIGFLHHLIEIVIDKLKNE